MDKQLQIGFISTRFSGTDGVSLETVKWVQVLTGLGHQCYFFAGESQWPADQNYLVPEAHFKHPDIRKINVDLFDDYIRSSETSLAIEKIQDHLKYHLHQFIEKFAIDLLIVENALALPMNVPLGLAITTLIAETGIPTFGHHHDFTWERQRYAISAGDDYIRAAFPPTLKHVHHIVINSYAQTQLALRTGASSTLIPNVMDFDHEPESPDDYARSLRSDLGLAESEALLLQPTRIVPRKRIEQAIELAGRIPHPARLVITHSSGDEGPEYEDYLRDYAEMLAVKVIFASNRFAPERGTTENGEKIYSLKDAYQLADLVTYPSRIEGFGNAFLETVYYRRPILMNRYEIFKTDIQPKNFQIIPFDDFISHSCIKAVLKVLTDPEYVAEQTARNYELGKRYYSFRFLETQLKSLLHETIGSSR
jgi:mannosylglucosylglycerate synthase